MADGDGDLALRLPWGRVSRPDDEAFAAPPATALPGDLAPGDEPVADPGTQTSTAVAVGVPAAFGPPPPEFRPDAGPPFDPTALHRRLDTLLEAIDVRFGRLDTRLAHLERTLPEQLELIGARLTEAAAADAALDLRLDRLKVLVAFFREATMDALGRNCEQIVAALDSSHAALTDRMAQLAPADLVARLIQGVVTTGEMLDAELIELKRLVADLRPPGP